MNYMFETPAFSTFQICGNMLEREPDFLASGIRNFLNKIIKAGLVSLPKKEAEKEIALLK